MIEIKHLTKDYGNQKGVFDLSLEVAESEVFGFLGPNGAGKTTTIRNLLGFIKPTSGQCYIDAFDCWQDAAKIQTFSSYLPGEIAFIDEMKGMEFIKFIAEMNGLKSLAKANELISYFELDTRGSIRKMSKGTKQKIALVCTFMLDSKVIILDEPSSGLDPLMQNKFIDLVLLEKKKGKTIFMSSHIFEEIEKCCDRTAIIKDGKLVAIEKMDDLKKSKRKIYDINFVDEMQAKSFVETIKTFDKINDSNVTVSVIGDINPLLQLLAKYDVVDLSVRTQSLEELFLHYYGGND